MSESKKKKRKKKFKFKLSKNIGLSILLLVIFCGCFAGVKFWEDSQDENEPMAGTTLSAEDTEPSGTTEPAGTGPAETDPTQTTALQHEPRKINFLLIGQDDHSEGENGRSDSMILCSVDTGAKTVTLTSFLRDIYLQIPGHESNRLNASYSWGGAELLNQTLEKNFGVQVDVNLEIDFDGFESIIDYLGGVDIQLTDMEASHLNQNNGWSLTAGTNHLNGAQALAYSRIRYLDSDFYRTERQRNVLLALLYQYQTASLEDVLNATAAFLEECTSDHSDEELLAYALELYEIMAECEVVTHRVPADGTYSYETIRGMSVVVIDFEANIELLTSLLE